MILLSFDIEEFDMPFEYGKDISIENQIAVSEKGMSNSSMSKLSKIICNWYC